jgi:malate synthase
MMENRVNIAGLKVDKALYELVAHEIAPGTGVEIKLFWTSLSDIVRDLGPKNQTLLSERDHLQTQIDQWHRQHSDQPMKMPEYKKFLARIGYLIPEGPDFQITVKDVDPEISRIAGPQLVVPLDNARYALNAANARWGSLYDALYGTDVIPEDQELAKGSAYNPLRGAQVFEQSWRFLDQAFPFASGRHADVRRYMLKKTGKRYNLAANLEDGKETGLSDPEKFAGYREENGELKSILLRNNDLHVELQIDRTDAIGSTHPAGIKDIYLEAAVTTIQDCEDSVAAVDAEDKCRVYRNWLGLMKGTLAATFIKDGRQITRRLNPDKDFMAPDAQMFSLPGRSLMLVRNVGLHMYTDAVTTAQNEKIPETFLDAMVTVLAAIHDFNGNATCRNSRSGSIYIVKPKLHGPKEVAASVELFDRVEKALGLAPNTIKIGIMDEERRTTVNLKECIRQAEGRTIFINTGFLDRTGDEIHTDMEAGPVIPKAQMKASTWMLAYEDWNVDVGLKAGLMGKAQIGKGMWAMPDNMRSMVEIKGAHPEAGANTAWVPSPTAATLHALHYHRVNVFQRQQEIAKQRRASLEGLLTVPLMEAVQLNSDQIQTELENNAQSILGYVVRWIDQGIGCSKVPDIHDVALMEDRATLRISSQHIANWLYHGLISQGQVVSAFEKMARVVDQQNTGDANYRPMSPNFSESIAFQGAIELILKGRERPNGYTEWTLHAYRKQKKALDIE